MLSFVKNKTIHKTGLFLCLFITNSAISQESTEQFEDSVDAYLYSDPDKMIRISHKFLRKARVDNNIENIFLSNNILAVANEVKDNIDSTLIYYYKNLSLSTTAYDIIQYKFSIGKIYEKGKNTKNSNCFY